jgi:hypothetical protein
MYAEDLLQAVFPDAVACQDNIQGAREIPDHPLVHQALRDALEEAVDANGLEAVLTRLVNGEIGFVARDTPEPSVLSHELLNSAVYTFLDDAPLEERRTRAVYTRRATEVRSADDLGALDPAAIERVRQEAWPVANTADEMYDALMVAGYIKDTELAPHWPALLTSLGERVVQRGNAWFALERKDDEPLEILASRLEVLGPVTEQTANADAFSTRLTRAQQAQRYVDGPLRAAWDVVHRDKRKKVLGGAFTPWQQAADRRNVGNWTLAVTQAYVRAGYLDRVDYAGFHPDLPTAAAQRDWVRRAAALFGDKPIWVSEWQLTRSAFPDDGAYVAAMGSSAQALRGELGTACYSGFTQEEGVVPVTEGGLGGYREEDPAFDAYRDWPKS